MWIFSSILKVWCNEACICLIPNQQGLTALALSIPALVTMKIYCFKGKQPPHHFTPKTFGKCPWKIIVHAHRALSPCLQSSDTQGVFSCARTPRLGGLRQTSTKPVSPSAALLFDPPWLVEITGSVGRRASPTFGICPLDSLQSCQAVFLCLVINLSS